MATAELRGLVTVEAVFTDLTSVERLPPERERATYVRPAEKARGVVQVRNYGTTELQLL
jgi:hypothetical protein